MYIGVTTRMRSSILPDVPTFAASGLPNYSFEGWLAPIGPPGLPKLDKHAARVKRSGATVE